MPVLLHISAKDQFELYRAEADALYADANIFTAEGCELFSVSDKLRSEANKRCVRANELRDEANKLYAAADEFRNMISEEAQNTTSTGQHNDVGEVSISDEPDQHTLTNYLNKFNPDNEGADQ